MFKFRINRVYLTHSLHLGKANTRVQIVENRKQEMGETHLGRESHFSLIIFNNCLSPSRREEGSLVA